MKFTELFTIDYNGTIKELKDILLNMEGIESIRINDNIKDETYQINSEITCSITYDAYLTDRTELAQTLEKQHENIKEIMFA